MGSLARSVLETDVDARLAARPVLALCWLSLRILILVLLRRKSLAAQIRSIHLRLFRNSVETFCNCEREVRKTNITGKVPAR